MFKSCMLNVFKCNKDDTNTVLVSFFFVKMVCCNIMCKYMVSLWQTVPLKNTVKDGYLTDLHEVSFSLNLCLIYIHELAFPGHFNHGLKKSLATHNLSDRHCDNLVNHCQQIKADFNQLFSTFLSKNWMLKTESKYNPSLWISKQKKRNKTQWSSCGNSLRCKFSFLVQEPLPQALLPFFSSCILKWFVVWKIQCNHHFKRLIFSSQSGWLPEVSRAMTESQ